LNEIELLCDKYLTNNKFSHIIKLIELSGTKNKFSEYYYYSLYRCGLLTEDLLDNNTPYSLTEIFSDTNLALKLGFTNVVSRNIEFLQIYKDEESRIYWTLMFQAFSYYISNSFDFEIVNFVKKYKFLFEYSNSRHARFFFQLLEWLLVHKRDIYKFISKEFLLDIFNNISQPSEKLQFSSRFLNSNSLSELENLEIKFFSFLDLLNELTRLVSEEPLKKKKEHALSEYITNSCNYEFLYPKYNSHPFFGSEIPLNSKKTIIQYWDFDVPNDIGGYMNKVKEINCSLGYQLFDFNDARDFIKENSSELILSFFDSTPKAAFQADIFRLVYLLHNGGIWIDADELAKDPINEFIYRNSNSIVISCLNEFYGGYYVNNDFIYVPKNSNLMKRIYIEFENRVFQSKSDHKVFYYGICGPHLWSDVINQALLKNFKDVDCLVDIKFISRNVKESFFSTIHSPYKDDPKRNWRSQ
jgi:hypothetical protein